MIFIFNKYNFLKSKKKGWRGMISTKNNIYIVDDDESVCRALKFLLMTYGFEVKTFNSSNEFFNAVSKDDLGCLVLDIHMPGVDGWEMQKKILDTGSKRPVIFISAEKQSKGSDRAIRVGAVGFLQKPFDGQTLVDLINVASKNTDDVMKK